MDEPYMRARNAANTAYVTVLSQRERARTLTREEWHLFTATVNANGQVSVYVDNAPINSTQAVTVLAVPHQSDNEAYLSAYTIFYSLFGHAPDGHFQAQMKNAVGKVIASDPALFFDTWTTP